MKLTEIEFKKLQKYWYERLSKSGFKDIEHKETGLIVMASARFKAMDLTSKGAKQKYFEAITQIIESGTPAFQNEIDKYVLTRYSEGAYIKTIVEELVARGTPRERKTIRFIIRRYEMAWNIRTYTPTQLNLKKIL